MRWRPSRAIPEPFNRVHPPQCEGRREAKDECGQHAETERDGEYGAVDGGLGKSWHRLRAQAQDCGEGKPPDQQSEGAAHQRQHETLHQELPQHAHSARAQRNANGHLFLSRRRARQQQVRNVGTRNQQHERNGRQQHPKCQTSTSGQLVVKRHDPKPELLIEPIRIRMLLNDAVPYGFELGSCLFQRHALPEPADHIEQADHPLAYRRDEERLVDVDFLRPKSRPCLRGEVKSEIVKHAHDGGLATINLSVDRAGSDPVRFSDTLSGL